MSADWVAGSVRATGLLVRRLDAAKLREIATAGSLLAAQQRLAESSYRRRIRVGATLADTEHALGEETVWRLRVLAGWQPRAGVALIRVLAGAFEVADIAGLAAGMAGTPSVPPYQLGALTTAWSRVRDARSPGELRAALARTPWGDPGSDDVADIADGVAIGWAARVAGSVPDAGRWALALAALLTARRQLLQARPFPAPTAHRIARLLGPSVATASDPAAFRAALPRSARWVLTGIDSADSLWRAEFGWWRQLEQDGRELLREHRFDASSVVGTVALLTADAWRVRAALQVVATDGLALEDFDELVA
ncbi:hypothetical protein GPX89_14565 [Nocardia sp. ET3-3]|uniref:V-type ATPase subunit n=1 Tax=Nocardia terrae TaxID=2675851 RepID=A0A7K1UVR4_9NOCA|nr:hypothetical protein [Nocardia terrae]MVU78464.1 hypothetical protein [Nocardia terrae]